jgi:3-dehydroquinate dehydratase / shikimate dehydrogenase
MICVSIGRGRHRHMIAEHRALAEQGAKLVELRLDYITGAVNIKRLLANRPCPVVISCRRLGDGGKWSGSEEQRQLLLRTAIAEGVEYIDLEDDIAAGVPRFGKTKRIVSFHDFRKTPENLEEIHRRLSQCNADIVKLSTMSNHPSDNVRILNMVRNAAIPTIGLGMGDIGVPTRILAGKFGAPHTYATFHHDRALAPGQLSFEHMTQVYHYDQINADTEVYGVVADPIGHSLSPLIHNAAFAHLGLNKVYVPFRVPREDLGRFMDEAAALGIRGLSVTIPHKESVVKTLDKADAAVQGIGAANTVVFDGATRAGYNTDYHAAIASLVEAMELAAAGERPFSGKTALVMGCGGAGMAIAYGLVRGGAHVLLTDITHRKAETMAERFDCVAVDWADRHKANPDILVNCTPVGMHPNVDESPYEKHHLRPAMVVFDAVYNPENTLLIKDARNRNCTVVTGIEMFVGQACMQFKLFTGCEGPADVMRNVIRRTIGAAKV